MTPPTVANADALVAAIAAVSDPGTRVESIAEALGKVEALERWAKEVRAMLKDAMVAHIEATGRDLVVGAVRFYVGHPKDTSNLDKAMTLDLLFKAANGDMAKVADCLCSQTYKHGTCRTVLAADDYASVFVTTSKPKLVEGVAKKQLISVPTEMLPR